MEKFSINRQTSILLSHNTFIPVVIVFPNRPRFLHTSRYNVLLPGVVRSVYDNQDSVDENFSMWIFRLFSSFVLVPIFVGC